MLNDLKGIRIENYDYPLPEQRIARYPLAQRDQSKLLALRGDTLSQHRFRDLPALLPTNAMLVFNDTRVIHARLFFKKETGATIEIFCLEPHSTPISEAFQQRHRCTWTCLIGNNKKWKSGPLNGTWQTTNGEFTLTASRRQPAGNAWIVDFEWSGGYSFAEVIETAGVIPLPPYMNRQAELSDSERYQTIYAHHDGSVAAPTAGLHFTPKVINSLKNNGFQTEYITLHVGAGTFKPVSTPTIGQHEMHVEPVHVTTHNLQHLIDHQDQPIIAVGTTTVRTLESLYWFGTQLHLNPNLSHMHIHQWDPYTLDAQPLSYADAYRNILKWLHLRGSEHLHGATQLMIAPGYQYRVINGLITNFHQPKSTLLLLVSALIGDRWRQCYRFALEHSFRFLSYGDSCLLLP